MAGLVAHGEDVDVLAQHVGNAGILQGVKFISFGETQVLAQGARPEVTELLFGVVGRPRSAALAEEILIGMVVGEDVEVDHQADDLRRQRDDSVVPVLRVRAMEAERLLPHGDIPNTYVAHLLRADETVVAHVACQEEMAVFRGQILMDLRHHVVGYHVAVLPGLAYLQGREGGSRVGLHVPALREIVAEVLQPDEIPIARADGVVAVDEDIVEELAYHEGIELVGIGDGNLGGGDELLEDVKARGVGLEGILTEAALVEELHEVVPVPADHLGP